VFFSENKRSDENVLIGVIIVLGIIIIIIVIISIIAYKWFTRKRDEDNSHQSHAQSGSTAEQIEMTSKRVRQRSRNN
jgi:uncharacterized membrane protein